MNKNQSIIKLRGKMLGVRLADARLSTHQTIEECALICGVDAETYQAYESGEKSPSLPEIEQLARHLEIPYEHFWSGQPLARAPKMHPSENLPRLLSIRNRMVGARLRQERVKKGLSLEEVSETLGISEAELDQCELGKAPLPMPVLETLAAILSFEFSDLFEGTVRPGAVQLADEKVKNYLTLPQELQEFVSRPINRPYLDLAVKLSEMPAEKLRMIAEGLLEITY